MPMTARADDSSSALTNMEATSKRKVNWSNEEEVILVEEVSKREGVLFGRLDGSQRTTLRKTKAGEEIACLINSRGRSGLRTLSEIKKKYQHIKQKAKAKRTFSMRPATGGGPRTSSPSVPGQIVLDNLEGRPSSCGVVGRIDTEDFQNISETAHDGAVTTEVDIKTVDDMAFNITDLDPTILSNTLLGDEPAVHVKVSAEEEILKEKLETIKDSRQLIKEQIRLVKLQQKVPILQIRNIDPTFSF